MLTLQDKVAIVTGSSRGIGSAIARKLAAAGAAVVVNYLGSKDAAEKAAADIAASGGKALTVKADVSISSDVKHMFDETIAAFGKVDILVNNAGIAIYKPIEDATEQEFDRIFRINVKSVFLGLREAAIRLENNGRIVNVSSSVTRFMLPTYAMYSATKAAVEQFTRIFAAEVGSRGITVNAVLPGPTNTDLFLAGKTEETIKRLAAMTALGRIGEPEDIARVVLFLVSDEAAWISAQCFGANGGFA